MMTPLEAPTEKNLDIPPLSIVGKIRSASFVLAWGGITLIMGVLFAPFFLLPRRWAWFPVRVWTQTVLWMARVIVGICYEVRGQDHLPTEGGIIAGKHQSAWETLIFLVLLENPSYILKKELLSIPIYGWYVRKIGMIAIDRSGKAVALRDMMKRARTAAEQGRTVIIFPEGTRVKPGEQKRFLPGIAALYEQLEKPVVPVALNSGLYWGKGFFGKRPGIITMEILPAIATDLSKADFMAHLTYAIQDRSQALEQISDESKGQKR